MNALFWNIGDTLTDRKLELVSEAIASQSPDIFCLAEGSRSREDCQKIVSVFEKHKYICYYSPLFVDRTELDLQYDYNGYGLKVFVRNDTIPKVQFSFSQQRHEGRIIILKAYKEFRWATFIFIHNKSQVGNPTLNPIPYIFTLKAMIELGKVADDKNPVEISEGKERIIIMGDFNLEPWDDVLKHKDFLNTSFFKNHNAIKKRSTNADKYFFNPLAGLIFQSEIENLGGTFYKDNIGWALFDFILYDTASGNIFYDVITKFEKGSKLLNEDTSLKRAFLNDGLDHLPIISKIVD